MRLLVTILLLVAGLGTATAQPRRRPPEGRPVPMPPARMLERLCAMTPEERQRLLERLPPQRRAQIEKRLERFQQLPPAERQRLLARWEAFNRLPPERQQQVRRVWRDLSQRAPDRRRALNQAFFRLRGMSEEVRRERMASPAFEAHFSSEERDLLRRMLETLGPEEPAGP